MIGTALDLAKYRIDKACNHLKSAEILFTSGMYDDSLGRSYYAMLAAARALLALKQLDSKKHSGVISLFNQHFVKTGIVDKVAGKQLGKARVNRESSDYVDFYVTSREDAQIQLETAKTFLTAVEAAFQKVISNPIRESGN